jgi:hypothetical protein
MAKVTVKLDANNQVIVDPPILDFDRRGVETIHWVRDDTNFTFVALVFAAQNPCYNTIVKDDEITTQDDNQGDGDHRYTIFVKTGSRRGKGEIKKPGGGGPIIRNN